ncbi:VCBS repeat-containing protein [Nonomuraea sp. KC401]|uniref:FG-GAP repeat domain-containing protein n=1 Tax=unclassified Nonomuraea TaxID=2593643 RepID=UPI0010FDAEE8|nr:MULTISPECIES: VCBS repeat-containing protein [unclassified Nonomuraea]NBE99296.1 hypothetical protein [Nonomuraea sp. K271]TLF58986.1 VCBS repeat-containing protein [Nonomuraea sp. KC401]
MKSIRRLSARSCAAVALLAAITALPLSTPAQVSAREEIRTVGAADWDGDGHQDIVAYAANTGLLWLYPGESKRGYSSQQRVQIGHGWCGYRLSCQGP